LLLLYGHLRDRLGKGVATLLLTAACCLPLAVALQRIAAGRHFLSDTVFAVLFTLLLALGLSLLLRRMPRPMRWVRPRPGAVPTER
jgi:membrane-associated phospholipid phosphatase